MTVGSATFKTVLGIAIVFLISFGCKEVIFNFFPLLENMSPDADWWNPFIDSDIAKLIYPNESVDMLIKVFWTFVIGMIIGLVHNVIEVAQEIE